MIRFFSAVILVFICIFSFFKFIGHFSSQPDLTILGFMNMNDGLGRQSGDLIDAFRDELDINLVETRKTKGNKIPARFQKCIQNKKIKWGKIVLYEDMLWAPNYEKYRKILESNKEKSIRIAYSMWESTKIPYEWVLILNEYFDAVAVPSTFLIEVYKNCGVSIPIFELPLGLNLKNFLAEPLKQKQGDPFVFANLSACSERKNQILLIRAFEKAFGNDPHTFLRINCRAGEKEVSSALTKEIVNLNLNNVIFTQFSLNSKEYLDLFKSIDCYVSPSKGEGFSIQPREAMSLGIPVIATNNTGQLTICQTGLVNVIQTPVHEPAIFPWGNYYGKNFNCNLEDLVDALQEIRTNYELYLNKASAAREWAKYYQYENSLKCLYKCLIKPKKIVLCEENRITENCLFTNSCKLYEKYLQIFDLKDSK